MDTNIKTATKRVQKMQADLGGTEIYNPLHTILKENNIEGYPRQIFLLTDGQVSDTERVLQMVGNNCKYSRVHSIGVGDGCSEELVAGCARKGKGSHVFIKDTEDPSEKIIQLLADSLSPAITRVKLDFDRDVVESIIPNPESMPYVLKN